MNQNNAPRANAGAGNPMMAMLMPMLAQKLGLPTATVGTGLPDMMAAMMSGAAAPMGAM